MLGGWLLSDPTNNKIIKSASVIFPCFQSLGASDMGHAKVSLSQIINTVTLGQVPTERCLKDENQAVDLLPLTKNILVRPYLGSFNTNGRPHAKKNWSR
ncbi:hypothetical protein O181_061811 [Austropuccinia psidii MF-1]|uniref:Uncharacterized protein n=1 Tax=Austropuccinia psidii MF-1 TaxID=1389203 RepID=A0A9Q3ENK1_9BASI|nr:hypothetical protein [Austropuccinia psidii MF-1]